MTDFNSHQEIRTNLLEAQAANERAFTLRAFVVITTLFLVAWALTG